MTWARPVKEKHKPARTAGRLLCAAVRCAGRAKWQSRQVDIFRALLYFKKVTITLRTLHSLAGPDLAAVTDQVPLGRVAAVIFLVSGHDI